MDRLDVTKSVASQRVYFDPQTCSDPAGRGRPTATPSVAIKDRYGQTITAAATTYVTQDTVNTTIKSATSVAVGAKTATLTSGTGLEVGAKYLMTNSTGQKEWVTVIGANTSSGVVTFDEACEYAYAAGDAFVGCRFYYTLQSAEVDELVELYRARATYVVGGRTWTLEVPFDVVLTPLPNLLTVDFIKLHRPDLMAQEFAESRGTDMAGLREVAWDRVRKGLRENAEGWRPALLRTPEGVEEWGLREFELAAHDAGIRVLRGDWTGDAAIEHLEGRVTRAKQAALSSLEFMDLDEDDSQSADETRPLKMDCVR